jgi:hypothetical protein
VKTTSSTQVLCKLMVRMLVTFAHSRGVLLLSRAIILGTRKQADYLNTTPVPSKFPLPEANMKVSLPLLWKRTYKHYLTIDCWNNKKTTSRYHPLIIGMRELEEKESHYYQYNSYLATNYNYKSKGRGQGDTNMDRSLPKTPQCLLTTYNKAIIVTRVWRDVNKLTPK